MNQVIQQLKERKSVRVFTEKPISQEEISAILASAVNAPRRVISAGGYFVGFWWWNVFCPLYYPALGYI